ACYLLQDRKALGGLKPIPAAGQRGDVFPPPSRQRRGGTGPFVWIDTGILDPGQVLQRILGTEKSFPGQEAREDRAGSLERSFGVPLGRGANDPEQVLQREVEVTHVPGQQEPAVLGEIPVAEVGRELPGGSRVEHAAIIDRQRALLRPQQTVGLEPQLLSFGPADLLKLLAELLWPVVVFDRDLGPLPRAGLDAFLEARSAQTEQSAAHGHDGERGDVHDHADVHVRPPTVVIRRSIPPAQRGPACRRVACRRSLARRARAERRWRRRGRRQRPATPGGAPPDGPPPWSPLRAAAHPPPPAPPL